MAEVLRAPKNHSDWYTFVILKKIDGVAIIGGCTRCGRKFFTPSTLFQDPSGAEDYLRGKFSDHECEHSPKTDVLVVQSTGGE